MKPDHVAPLAALHLRIRRALHVAEELLQLCRSTFVYSAVLSCEHVLHIAVSGSQHLLSHS